MLTQDAFEEHKSDYTIYRKTATIGHYRDEVVEYTAGGTVHTMFTPVSDEASIQTYGEKVHTMRQAVIYEDTDIDPHDQVEIEGHKYEVVSIQRYPSYRLVRVQRYD